MISTERNDKPQSLRFRHVLIVITVCVMAPMSHAQQTRQADESSTASSAQQSSVSLNIKPSICVAPRGSRRCSSDFNIDWLSNQAGHYCLTSTNESSDSDDQHQAVRHVECWQGLSSGEHIEYVVLESDLIYHMNDPDNVSTLARAKVKLAMLKPHRKYPRRRSRLPWSVIKP